MIIGCFEDVWGVELWEVDELFVLGVSLVMSNWLGVLLVLVGIMMFFGLLDNVFLLIEFFIECLVLFLVCCCMIVLLCWIVLVWFKLLVLDEDGLGLCVVLCCLVVLVLILSVGEWFFLFWVGVGLFLIYFVGVGGIGFNVEFEFGGGWWVGGEMIGIWFWFMGCMFCDCVFVGGGLGGGGGIGMLGFYFVWDVDFDFVDVGVLIVFVEVVWCVVGGVVWFLKIIELGWYGLGVCIEVVLLFKCNGGGGVWCKFGGEVGLELVFCCWVKDDRLNWCLCDVFLLIRFGGGGKFVVGCFGEGWWKFLLEGRCGIGGGGVEELEKCLKVVFIGCCCDCGCEFCGGLYGGGGNGVGYFDMVIESLC